MNLDTKDTKDNKDTKDTKDTKYNKDNKDKEQVCNDFIKEYEVLWRRTGLAGWYLVIAEHDLWGHSFYKMESDADKQIKAYHKRKEFAIKHII